MATTYRQAQPLTLADLFAQQLNTGGGVNAPPLAAQPPQAPALDSGQITPEQRSALLEALMQPEDVGPAPVVEQRSAGKTLANSFGDAFNNIATIYAGGADLRSDGLNQYFNRLERQKAEMSEYQRRKGDAERRSKAGKANYILGEDQRATERVLGEKQRLTEKGEAASALREKRAYEEGQAAIEHQREVEKETRRQEAEIKKEKIRADAGIAEERIREGIRQKDAYAKDQNERLEAQLTNLKELSDEIQTTLVKTPPAQIRKLLDKELRVARLGPDAMAIVKAFIEEEIEPALQIADYNTMTDEQEETNKANVSKMEEKVASVKTPKRAFGTLTRGR